MNPETVGARIKKARKLKGLSQEELADLCGYTTQARISNYERGFRNASLDEVELIAEKLGVTAEWILFGDNQLIKKAQKFMKSLGPEFKPEDLDRFFNEIDASDGIEDIRKNSYAPLHLANEKVPVICLNQLSTDVKTTLKKIMDGEMKVTEYAPAPGCSKSSIGILVEEESISDLLIGDIVVIDPDEKPVPGDTVVASIRDRDTPVIRRYAEGGSLYSDTKKHLDFDSEVVESVYGVDVGFFRKRVRKG